MGGLLAGAALAVDGGSGDRLGEAGPEHGVPGDVHALLIHLANASGDNVVHHLGVYT